MAKADPAPFMSKDAQRLVTPGNLEDDLERLAEVDWIVEAVIEQLEIKQALYARLEAVRKPGGIVSSNTSTLPLARLTEGLPESFRRDFLITHFFNPPRYMRLLEVVAGPETRAAAVEELAEFADHRLGKSVVRCKDTPGFVANRIGSFWMQAAFCEAFETGLPVEEADLVLGRPLGIPKTGIFGLADLVGIDLLPHVAASLRAALAAGRPVPRGRPRVPADRAADRDRLHRAQGQGRLLSPQPGGRRAGQAGDRSRERRLSPCRQAAPRGARRGQGRRAARAVRDRRAGGALRLAGDEPDARLCLRAGARDRGRDHRGR